MRDAAREAAIAVGTAFSDENGFGVRLGTPTRSHPIRGRRPSKSAIVAVGGNTCSGAKRVAAPVPQHSARSSKQEQIMTPSASLPA